MLTVCRVMMWLAPLAILGCGPNGPKTYPVTGEVVFEDGVVMQGGIIEFTSMGESSEQKISSRGTIGLDGKFRLTTIHDGDGAVAGEHRAIVLPQALDGLIEHHHDAKTLRRPDKRFASYSTSGLKFTIRAGEKNHFQVVVAKAK